MLFNNLNKNFIFYHYHKKLFSLLLLVIKNTSIIVLKIPVLTIV